MLKLYIGCYFYIIKINFTFFLTLFNVATRTFVITYVVLIHSSYSISVGHHWIRVSELQLGASRRRNPFQNNNQYAQSRQHWRIFEAENCLQNVVDKI